MISTVRWQYQMRAMFLCRDSTSALVLEESKKTVRGKRGSGMDSPLITKEWRDANLETYRKIKQTPDECPICYRGRRDRPDIEPLPRFVCFDSPLSNGLCIPEGKPVRCRHLACDECWNKIKKENRRCPICRDDLTCWFEHTRRRRPTCV